MNTRRGYIVYRKSQELLVSFQLSTHCYKGYNEYFVPMQIFQKMTEQPDNVDSHTVFVLVERLSEGTISLGF